MPPEARKNYEIISLWSITKLELNEGLTVRRVNVWEIIILIHELLYICISMDTICTEHTT